MCGIAGLTSVSSSAHELHERVRRMTAAIKHRGPDGSGARAFGADQLSCAVALGHRRLSIIDLSDAGLQPMRNEDGTIWVVFNGEIYNFQALRDDLLTRGHTFHSATDTEVLVHLYEDLGPSFVDKLNGIFAFAILDCRTRRILLARDHIGVKPLYYSASADGLAFGSEIKALLAARKDRPGVNWQAIYDYFTFLYIPGPQTAFEGIEQLPPAHTLLYDFESRRCTLTPYWHVDRSDIARAAKADVEEVLYSKVLGAVQRELVSDVPLGVFLSGGIDSAALTGLASESGVRPRTFTVDFSSPDLRYYSEARLARATSQFLNTDHHQLDVASSDPIEMLGLLEFFDQPFGNPTFYLQWLIARCSREHMTVALSGAGGDELFAGYPRYRAAQLSPFFHAIPRFFIRAGRRVFDLFKDSHRTMRLRRVREFLDGLDDDPVHEFAHWTYYMTAEEKAQLFARETEQAWDRSERHLQRYFEESPFEGGNRLLHVDVRSFLVDNLLEYTDRMSMAVGMEVRVPLLEPDIVAYALNVPFGWKLGARFSKIIERDAFQKFLTPEVRQGAKRGFNAPLGMWMRGALDEYFVASRRDSHPLKDMLGSDIGASWGNEGVLNWSYIETLRRAHRDGRQDVSYELFAVIAFDVWWRKYVAGTLAIEHWSTTDSDATSDSAAPQLASASAAAAA